MMFFILVKVRSLNQDHKNCLSKLGLYASSRQSHLPVETLISKKLIRSSISNNSKCFLYQWIFLTLGEMENNKDFYKYLLTGAVSSI